MTAPTTDTLDDTEDPGSQTTDRGDESMHRLIAEQVLRIRRQVNHRRWAVDRNTFLNEAFDKDAQYVEFDPSRRVVVTMPAPRDTIRRTINLTKPYNRTQESRLSRGQPTYQATAMKDDPDGEDAAELAGDLIPWIAKLINVRKIRQKIGFWLQRAGTVILFNLWDFESGPVVQGDEGEEVPGGLPMTDVHPPHEVFYYPQSATDIESAQGIGRDIRLGRAEASLLFPDIADKLSNPTSDDTFSSARLSKAIREFPPGQSGWHAQTLGFGVTGISAADNLDSAGEDEAMLIEFWVEAGAAMYDPGDSKLYVFPDGLRLVMTTMGEIAHWGPNVYERLPATRIGYSESAGFWAPAPATPLRPLQMAINWAYSLWEEHMILAGRPIMLWPKQAKAAWRRLQDLTTKILQYVAGPKGQGPGYLDPPSFPTKLPELLKFLLDMWQDISGVHEVSKGQLPSAGISGVAISLLQDQDDTQLGFAIGEIENGLANIMEQHLDNIRRFVQFEMLAEGLGDSKRQARVFKGVDLQEGVDIAVVPGSALPKAPAATQAMAKEAWLGGYFMDEYSQPDWRRLQVVMGLGNEDRLFDEMQQDKNNASLENDTLMGLPPEEIELLLTYVRMTGTLPDEFLPRRYDDHVVHEVRHKRFLKEARERMAQGDSRMTPSVLTLIELHWEMHQLPALEQRMGMPHMGGFGAATGEVNPQGQPGAEPQAGAQAAQEQKAAPSQA